MQKMQQARRKRISVEEKSAPILLEAMCVLHHLDEINLVRVKVTVV